MNRFFSKLKSKKILRFLTCGIITATFNIVLLAGIIQAFNVQTPLARNISNAVALELSIIFSFLLYRIWVWNHETWDSKKILFRQIPLYHASVSLIVLIRILILFPILDWIGLHYAVNNLIGILIGSTMNYFSGEKVIFKK